MNTAPFKMLFAATVVSVFFWISTSNDPGRFIFLPGGDVGLGFKSYAGRLEWIEYAPWDPLHIDTPSWSSPWWIVVALLTLMDVATAILSFERPYRFSLRTLLIVTTLVAAILGFAVWLRK